MYNLFCRDVKIKLLSLVKYLLRNGTSSCWLYCIPLLHFLDGRFQPYQVATPEVNHYDDPPRWWGNELFKTELNTFKSKYR